MPSSSILSESEPIDQTLFILNENNVYITAEYIEGVLKKYGVDHKVKNIETFQRAMTHVSYLIRDETNTTYNKQNKTKHTIELEPISDPSKAIPLQKQCYERLEFLGDSVIHLILAEYLFCRYEKEDEGFMTSLRTKIESGETLSLISTSIGLNKYILISRYIEKTGGRDNNTNVLEDSFEAFMGALFLEAGFDSCKRFFVQLMEQDIDFANILFVETNFKDRLLQYFHKMKWQDPAYGVMDVSGPDHKKNYTVYVKMRKTPQDDGCIVGIGVGTSKKRGEQEAAKDALIKFKEIKEVDSDTESIEEYLSSDSEELELIEDSDDS